MANAFTLFGELKADTRAFERSLFDAEKSLNLTEQAITRTEQKAKSIGNTTAATGRQFEKMNESVRAQRDRLNEAAQAYLKGDINAKRFASVITQTDSKIASLNSRLKDSQARLSDWATRASRSGAIFKSTFSGILAAGGVSSLSFMLRDLATDSVKMFGTLDKLTRFTATLDKSFQSPENLKKFQNDIKQLSTEIPHSAESIAKASFTIKSAFQNITEPELINYLREFGNAATASNTDIAAHAFNMAALAKQYKIGEGDLRSFSALMTSAFGQALATDEKVAQGFNRILSAAQSTKQPLADMVSAMSTLQSVSSDAEGNTTLLLNVYAKLTDPKYIKGIEAMGVSVFNAAGQFKPLNQLINEMAKELQGLSDKEVNEKLAWAKDMQAREGIKILIRQVAEYNKQLADGADEEAFKKKNELMLNSVEAKWQRLTNAVDNYKMSIGAGVVDAVDKIDSGLKKTGSSWGELLTTGLIGQIAKNQEHVAIALGGVVAVASQQAKAKANEGGQSVGHQLALGLQSGISGGQGGVIAAAVHLATSAYEAAKGALGIQSPSKKFFGIGKDVAQGFIDGIASMKTGVHAAMASLLDVSGIKGLGKKDAPGVELLQSLIRELDQLTPRTQLEAAMAELTAGKYKKLNAEIKNRIVLAAKQLDLEERRQKLFENMDRYDLKGVGMDHNIQLGDQQEGAGASGEVVLDFYEQLKKEIQEIEDAWNQIVPPPPADPWLNFWQAMHNNLKKFKDGLPSLKEALGVNLIDSIARVGDIFANAVTRWDGTIKGFFMSVAKGFAEMAQQIIAELIRIAVMKFVLDLISSFAGGGKVATAGATGGVGGAVGGIGGFARGGYTGSGGLKEIAGVVHKKEFVMPFKAVKAWGLPLLQGMKNLQAPPAMAMAGGSSATYNNQRSSVNHFHISVPAGANARETGAMIARAAADRMNREQMRNK